MAIRPYADWSEADLTSFIRSLEEGLASGVYSVSHNGETTTFRSASEMRATLEELRTARAFLTEPETARPAPVVRQVYPSFRRGL